MGSALNTPAPSQRPAKPPSSWLQHRGPRMPWGLVTAWNDSENLGEPYTQSSIIPKHIYSISVVLQFHGVGLEQLEKKKISTKIS